MERKDLEGDIILRIFFLDFLELFLCEHSRLTSIGRLALAHVAFEGGVRFRIVEQTGIGIFQLFEKEVRNAGLGTGACLFLRGSKFLLGLDLYQLLTEFRGRGLLDRRLAIKWGIWPCHSFRLCRRNNLLLLLVFSHHFSLILVKGEKVEIIGHFFCAAQILRILRFYWQLHRGFFHLYRGFFHRRIGLCGQELLHRLRPHLERLGISADQNRESRYNASQILQRVHIVEMKGIEGMLGENGHINTWIRLPHILLRLGHDKRHLTLVPQLGRHLLPRLFHVKLELLCDQIREVAYTPLTAQHLSVNDLGQKGLDTVLARKVADQLVAEHGQRFFPRQGGNLLEHARKDGKALLENAGRDDRRRLFSCTKSENKDALPQLRNLCQIREVAQPLDDLCAQHIQIISRLQFLQALRWLHDHVGRPVIKEAEGTINGRDVGQPFPNHHFRKGEILFWSGAAILGPLNQQFRILDIRRFAVAQIHLTEPCTFSRNQTKKWPPLIHDGLVKLVLNALNILLRLPGQLKILDARHREGNERHIRLEHGLNLHHELLPAQEHSRLSLSIRQQLG